MRRSMRGFLTIIVALAVIASGCGGKTPASGSAGVQPKDGVPTLSLNAIAKRGKVSIRLAGGHEAFLSNYGKNGFEGFGPDVGRRITEIIWGAKVEANISPVDSRTVAFQLVQDGDVPLVLDNWLPNGENVDSLHASPPFYVDSLRVMVREQDNVKKIKDLDGQRVAYLERQSTRTDVPRYFKEKHPDLRIEFEKLSRYGGKREGTNIVVGPASDFSSEVKDGSRMLLPERLETWNYSVYVHKQNTELANAVDKAIRQMTDSGELAKLAKKWGLDM